MVNNSKLGLITASTLNLITTHYRDGRAFPNWHQINDGLFDPKYGCVSRRIGVRLNGAYNRPLRDYVPLVNLIGVYFQIRDDLMNLYSKEVSPLVIHPRSTLLMLYKYNTNKGFAEDLTEGKFSFPVVHGIHANRTNRQILSKFGPIWKRKRPFNTYKTFCRNGLRPQR